MSIGNFVGGGRVGVITGVVSGSAASPIGGRFKRVFDASFAVMALVTLGALMLIIAAYLKLRSGGPVLFVQERVGLSGKPFPCIKFRTMVVDADARLKHILETDPEAAAEYAAIRKLKRDPRIIPGIGHLLRQSSLDELPQFINVLLGHMSIVGPRPVTMEEWTKYYGADHPYSFARPGITGLWQTSGRNSLDFATRSRMDANYIYNWNFLRDFVIIMRTVMIVCVNRNGY